MALISPFFHLKVNEVFAASNRSKSFFEEKCSNFIPMLLCTRVILFLKLRESRGGVAFPWILVIVGQLDSKERRCDARAKGLGRQAVLPLSLLPSL